ncbi:MAG: hypothetical protein LBH54_02115 [Clostridiales bacterium]|nr:hypothetical protein [Clostridiales bacterium]
MLVIPDSRGKVCRIWVDYSERDCYKNSQDYQRAIEEYQQKQYGISVFVGGEQPLLPVITELIRRQS